MKTAENNKNGLVLEGGAMRGLFTAGVIDVLMENGIRFDGIIGVSAGAAFGSNYKSHQIGRVIRYNLAYARDPRYCGVRCLLREGNYFSTGFCYGEVPRTLDPFDFDTYESDPTEFLLVVTDVETGKPVYHVYTGRTDHEFEWIRASASMPLVSRIVEIDGHKYLDGGVTDSIPARCMLARGYDKCVVVLTQPRGYRKKKNGLLPLIRVRYRSYPKFVEAAANRHNMYNDTLDYIAAEERSGRLYVISPDEPLPISKTETDPEVQKRVYEIGREVTAKQIAAIRMFLSVDR